MTINLFQVPRLLIAGLIALVCSVLLTRLILSLGRRRHLGQQVRDDGPGSHLSKQGTPSLGGLGMLGAVLIAVALVLAPLDGWSPRLSLLLALAVVFALLGLADDLAKMRAGSSRGVKARYRIVVEFLVALSFVLWIGVPGEVSAWGFAGLAGSLHGYGQALWIILAALVVVGSANAVNFTDGVDGLAATLVSICAVALGVACLLAAQWQLAGIAAAVAGAAAGFLWFNAYPAKIFMGDVGSLGLGALLGGIAVASGREWFFAIVAVVFVVEVLSVILQVVWFRGTGGRRLFRMTPIHHAFELRGWSEPQVVARFSLVGLLAAGLALFLLCQL